MTLFEQALYNNNSIPEVLANYEELLRETGNIEDLLHAAKLSEYENIIKNKSHSTLRKIFDDFYNILTKELPSTGFRIAGRRKSLISVEQKIQNNLSSNKSLESIRDLLGVRIILFDNTLDTCYAVLELFIKYCLEKGFTLCHVNDLESNFSSQLLNQFNYGIKDYISNPKGNGYQSLHAIFRNAAGFCFEVQIRTFDMHVHAAFGNSDHAQYKKEKYAELKFDRTKIQIPGYQATPNGILDLIGLEYSVEILQRNKNF